jgi:hypothetical protein
MLENRCIVQTILIDRTQLDRLNNRDIIAVGIRVIDSYNGLTT